MSDHDLCFLSATEALGRFRDRSLSPVELLKAQIVRAEAVEPTINALAYTFFDDALDAAKKAEARYMKTDGRLRRLEGLTLAVKEDTAVRGRPRTFGSLIFKDNIADHANPSVERLIRAGAIVHALTTCPEFVWPWTCTSRLHGVTRNPWNPEMTCGASSGGAAAAVASGTTTLATGSDSAGSIRMPAAMCGIAGYKPPYGRNPGSPEVAMDAFFHIGPMTRTAADAALMQNVMSGLHKKDHSTVAQNITLPERNARIRGAKIAYSIDMGVYTVAQDVRRNLLDTVALLRDSGATVEEVETPWAQAAADVSGNWGGLIYADEFSDAVNNHPDLVCDYTRDFADYNESLTPRGFHECMQVIGRTWAEFGPQLARYDAFLCPTVGATTIPADWPDWSEPVTVDGQPCDVHDLIMTFLFNVFSRCPALSVPSGFADNGVPTGVQIVSNPYDDKAVFRVAQALESNLDFSKTAV
ncbi:MAG: amidase [Rhodospirillaceae bacterium]|nr:amidase [Rhodospirillaceae bacterium]|tara:strand:- start:57414 stop:58823 length:1410 start_codon:yes stop_codon:yes gene_type:complete